MNDLVKAARRMRLDMERLDNDLRRVAASAGKLLALMDNADCAETLASIRSDTGFQLVKALDEAYGDLAGYLRSLAAERM